MAFAAALPPDGEAPGSRNGEVLAALAVRPDLEVHAFADRRVGGEFETAAFADRPTGEARPGRRTLHPQRASSRNPAEKEGQLELNGPAVGVPVHPLAALEAVEGLTGRFDAVVYALADDGNHTGCLSVLRRRRDGIVVAHDVFLAGLYGHAARSGGLPDGLAGTISVAYGEGVQSKVGANDTLPAGEARRLGLLLVRDVLTRCRRLIVTGPEQATLADLDSAPADRPKIHLTGPEPVAVAGALYEMVVGRSSV